MIKYVFRSVKVLSYGRETTGKRPLFFPVTLQCISSNRQVYSTCINMVTIAHAVCVPVCVCVCAGDTKARLLTHAHSDLDDRLFFPLSPLIITQFPQLKEHPAAYPQSNPRKHFQHVNKCFLITLRKYISFFLNHGQVKISFIVRSSNLIMFGFTLTSEFTLKLNQQTKLDNDRQPCAIDVSHVARR